MRHRREKLRHSILRKTYKNVYNQSKQETVFPAGTQSKIQRLKRWGLAIAPDFMSKEIMHKSI